MQLLTKAELEKIAFSDQKIEWYFAQCAAAGGAVLLDTKKPDWYRQTLCRRSIDFGSSIGNILHLVYGSFQVGVTELGLNQHSVVYLESFGFMVSELVFDEALTLAWQYQVDARRSR